MIMLSCGCHKGIPRQTEHSTGSPPTLLDLAPSEVFILSKLESAQEGKGFDGSARIHPEVLQQMAG
jgi:hypothetical protein